MPLVEFISLPVALQFLLVSLHGDGHGNFQAASDAGLGVLVTSCHV